jgi:hypothetical protein
MLATLSSVNQSQSIQWPRTTLEPHERKDRLHALGTWVEGAAVIKNR